MQPGTVYRPTLYLGTGILMLGFAVGLYHSFSEERRLPPLRLNNVVETHLDEINQLLEAGEYDRAIPQLELMLKLLPANQHLPHNMLGNAFAAKAKNEKAISHFRRALELKPDYLEARNNLAVSLARKGDVNGAIAELNHALRIDPDFEPAQINLRLMQPSAPAPDSDSDAPGHVVQGRIYARQFYQGELFELRANFAETLAAQMSLEGLTEMRDTIGRQLGSETALIDEQLADDESSKMYIRRARFEKHDGEVEAVFQLDEDLALLGLMFRPAEPRTDAAQ